MAGAIQEPTFAGYAPADSVHSRALERFRQLVEERSGGQIRGKVVPNILDLGQTAEEMLRRTETGEYAVCYLSTSYLANFGPKLGIFDLPFLFDSRERAYAIADGPLGEETARDIEAGRALVHLGFWENGFRHVTNSVRPVTKAADFAGLRIRLQPNALHEKTFQLLGATPIPTDISELIPGFESGRFNAQENPLDNTWTYGVYRYTRYISRTAHFFGVREMLAGRSWFEALPGDLQTVVRACATEASAYQRQLAGKRDEEMRLRLIEHDCLINDVDPAARAEFRGIVEPVYADAAEQVGGDFLKRVLRTEY